MSHNIKHRDSSGMVPRKYDESMTVPHSITHPPPGLPRGLGGFCATDSTFDIVPSAFHPIHIESRVAQKPLNPRDKPGGVAAFFPCGSHDMLPQI